MLSLRSSHSRGGKEWWDSKANSRQTQSPGVFLGYAFVNFKSTAEAQRFLDMAPFPRLKKKNKLKALMGDEPAQAIAGEAGEEGGMVTLGGGEYSDEEDGSGSEGAYSDEDRSGGEDSDDSNSSDGSDGEEDLRFGARQRRAERSIKDQEALALKMLRR